MHNWLRKTSIVAAVFLAAAVFVGCTQGVDETPQDTGPVVLQWWGVFWDENVVASLIAEYNQLNPGVEIQYANKWPGGNREIAAKLYQDELDRVLRDRNAVEIPDIFMVENTWVGNYEAYTAPAPASILDPSTVGTAFYPVVSQDFVAGGKVYGLPLWIDALAVLYNKDLLAQQAVSAPSSDWINFRDLARDMTLRSNGVVTRSGFAAGTGNNVSFASEMLNLLFLQNGVTITDSVGNPVFSADNDTSVALGFYKDFANSTGTWDDDQKNDALAFLEGEAAMIVATSWRYHDILYFNDIYDLGLNIGVAPMPQLQSQTQPRLNWATYWGNMVSIDRPNSGQAWDFLNWLTQPEQLRKLRANELLQREFFGFIYPRQDMQQELQADPFLREFNSALPTAQSWYMVDGLAVKESLESLIDSSGSASEIGTAENEVQQIIRNKGVL